VLGALGRRECKGSEPAADSEQVGVMADRDGVLTRVSTLTRNDARHDY
jgi:hypothetical protein